MTVPEARKRRALLVVGMHRSGTSAVTRVLSLLGAALPRRLMESGENNPRGYFESQRLFELHEELLADVGAAWDDLSPVPRAWFDSPDAARWAGRLADGVQEEFGDAALFTVKDPRVCRLVPLWIDALGRLDVEPLFIVPVRNPIDVASSLRRAEGTPDAKGMLLWLQYFLAAERDTRGRRRSFVAYDALLEDWRRAVDRIERDLGFEMPRVGPRAHAEIDDFLSDELRHRATSDDALAARFDVPAWVKRGHTWGVRAAAGDSPDPALLDAVAAEIAPAEAAFGPVVAGAELQRERREDELHRAAQQIARLDADREEQARELAEVRDESERRRAERDQLADRVGELEAQAKPLVEWVKSALQWAGGLVGGGEAAQAHLAFAKREIDSADLRAVPQLASAGIRLSQQAAESARLAEEADHRRAVAKRLEAELAAHKDALEKLRAEVAERRPDLEQRIAALQHEREAARQQVVGLWQQLAARDGALAAARHEATRRTGEAVAAHADAAAARADLGATGASLGVAQAGLAERDAVLAVLAVRRAAAAAERRGRITRLLVEGTGPAPGDSSGSLGRRLARLAGWTASFRLLRRLRERAAVREIAASGLFDQDFYRHANPDVAASRLDPVTHYVRHGAAEGRDPSPHFDTRFYLAHSPDVARAGLNPLAHFARAGGLEGRSPSRHFDAAAYLAAHPLLAPLGINPLAHWLAAAALPAAGPSAGAVPEGVRLVAEVAPTSEVLGRP